MPKTKTDPDSPEWTKKDTAKALRFDQLPAGLQQTLSGARRRGERGPQKTPTKVPISIRLSPDVLEALRATGPGWQTAADDVLREHFLKAEAAAAGA